MLKWTGERVVPERMLENDPTLLEHLTRYRFACSYCKDVTVLDAGCGSGYGTKMLRDVAKKVSGIDISKQAVEYAQNKYPDIYFDVCNLECSFPSARYDVIISFEVIEHLENPNYLLDKVSKSCNRFIFSIPLNNPSQFHKQIYSLDEIQTLINQYFNNIRWFEQTGVKISLLHKGSIFLIGVTGTEE